MHEGIRVCICNVFIILESIHEQGIVSTFRPNDWTIHKATRGRLLLSCQPSTAIAKQRQALELQSGCDQGSNDWAYLLLPATEWRQARK